jgi:hypothetical protein
LRKNREGVFSREIPRFYQFSFRVTCTLIFSSTRSKTDVVVIATLLIALFATVGVFFTRGGAYGHDAIDQKYAH